jgi:hypothetical protein
MTTPGAEQEREELAQWCENYASFIESGSDMARDETIFDEITNFRRIAEILRPRALTADARESSPAVTDEQIARYKRAVQLLANHVIENAIDTIKDLRDEYGDDILNDPQLEGLVTQVRRLLSLSASGGTAEGAK